MIITLTANPSIDRTIELPHALKPGSVQLAVGGREDAGGKGINVAGVVAAAGERALAVVPVNGDDPFAALLRDLGLDVATVPATGRARSNVTIVDDAGTTTKLNLPGAALGDAEREALIEAVVERSAGASWLVLAGSLPPGAGDDLYVRIIAAVRTAHGASAPLIALDTSGAPLKETVARSRPDLIKPNEEELAGLAGVEVPTTLAEVVDVARSIVPERAAAALVTLGADGAVLVTADGVWHGPSPRIEVASTVGAGDSALAGFLVAHVAGGAPDECLARAIRYGSAAAMLPGTQAPLPNALPDLPRPVARL